jgi:hypothetical protein
MQHAVTQIDGQDLNRDSTDRSSPNEHGTTPDEVLVPVVLSRVKQPRHMSRFRINACNIRAFVVVAENASTTPPRLAAIDHLPDFR